MQDVVERAFKHQDAHAEFPQILENHLTDLFAELLVQMSRVCCSLCSFWMTMYFLGFIEMSPELKFKFTLMPIVSLCQQLAHKAIEARPDLKKHLLYGMMTVMLMAFFECSMMSGKVGKLIAYGGVI